MNRYGAPAEFKFSADPATGVFEGYAAVFGNVDSHGDRIEPGAFVATLAEHKAAGTMPGLFVEHGPMMFGGDPLPSGVWTELAEDTKGLRGVGRISALDTDHGRRLRGLMQDGAMRGLSIGYRVPDGGAVKGKGPDQPRRTLVKLDLMEVSVVRDPSNRLARVDNLKAALAVGDLPTIRELESLLRDAGFSRSQAEGIAAHGFKALHRDDADHAEAAAILAGLQGFTLPTFR